MALAFLKMAGSWREQRWREIYQYLRYCDLVYVSFDVDALDAEFSKGIGTPVEAGLYLSEAENLC